MHVIVLTMLIFLSDHGMRGLAGLMIAAWFFYMVFDAYTTAKARRYGLPIPDPIGLNAILEGHEGAIRQRAEQAGGATPGGTASSVAPGEAAPREDVASGESNPNQTAHPGAPPPSYYAAPGYVAPRQYDHGPVGAVVLIALGVLFLLSNLGYFSSDWIRHYWPVILIATGLWMFIRRRGAR